MSNTFNYPGKLSIDRATYTGTLLGTILQVTLTPLFHKEVHKQ